MHGRHTCASDGDSFQIVCKVKIDIWRTALASSADRLGDSRGPDPRKLHDRF